MKNNREYVDYLTQKFEVEHSLSVHNLCFSIKKKKLCCIENWDHMRASEHWACCSLEKKRSEEWKSEAQKKPMKEEKIK